MGVAGPILCMIKARWLPTGEHSRSLDPGRESYAETVPRSVVGRT
jgi:hypothetical protein